MFSPSARSSLGNDSVRDENGESRSHWFKTIIVRQTQRIHCAADSQSVQVLP